MRTRHTGVLEPADLVLGFPSRWRRHNDWQALEDASAYHAEVRVLASSTACRPLPRAAQPVGCHRIPERSAQIHNTQTAQPAGKAVHRSRAAGGSWNRTFS